MILIFFQQYLDIEESDQSPDWASSVYRQV